MLYGILRDNTNTGADSELIAIFAVPVAIKSRKITFGSDTLSLKRSVSSSIAQRWEFEATIAQSDNGVEFFINSAYSDTDQVVYIRLPAPLQKGGSAIGAARGIAVSATDVLLADDSPTDYLVLSVGGDNLLIGAFGDTAEEYPMDNPQLISNSEFVESNGTAISSPGNVGETIMDITLDESSRIFLGNFIQFAGHDKIYLIKKINSISVNTANVEIMPPLISTVANAEAITLGSSIVAEMNYEIDNVFGITYSDGILTDPGTVRLVEAL